MEIELTRGVGKSRSILLRITQEAKNDLRYLTETLGKSRNDVLEELIIKTAEKLRKMEVL